MKDLTETEQSKRHISVYVDKKKYTDSNTEAFAYRIC